MSEKKILIVDDEIDFVHVLSTYLKAHGYSTVSASDAVGAIMVAQKEQTGFYYSRRQHACRQRIYRYGAAGQIRPDVTNTRRSGDGQGLVGPATGNGGRGGGFFYKAG